MSYVKTPPYRYVHRPDATISQANPVSGTPYVVLATTGNARIISISVQSTWTVQPTDLEVHITIDGQNFSFWVANPITAQPYEAVLREVVSLNQSLIAWSTNTASRAFLLEGRSILIRAETTGGTVTNLSCRVKYATE